MKGSTAMATAPTVETQEITVSLPVDVLGEIDRLAEEKGRTRDELLVGAARGYLFREERWREVQAAVAAGARESGLTEDDVEEYLDSLPDPPE